MHFDLRVVSYSPEGSSEATDQEALDLFRKLKRCKYTTPTGRGCLFVSLSVFS